MDHECRPVARTPLVNSFMLSGRIAGQGERYRLNAASLSRAAASGLCVGTPQLNVGA